VQRSCFGHHLQRRSQLGLPLHGVPRRCEMRTKCSPEATNQRQWRPVARFTMDGEKTKLWQHGGCSGMRCCSRARRWWHASFLWPGQSERAVEVAVGEEEQWRPSVAFQPKKKGKKEVSGRAHGQQRHGGGWGDWVSGV
jgi:hypothetical protein